MRADVHMHSSFSSDSEASPEQMILGAIAKGLEVICFTDHYDKDSMEWGSEDIFDPESYFRTLVPLKWKYKEKLEVRIGVELGLRPYLGEHYKELVERYPFDMVIGSVHSVPYKRVNGEDIYTDPAAGRLFRDRTDEEAYRLILETTLENVRTLSDYDVLGHLDYVVRYGANREKEYSYQRFADIIDEILRTLIEKEKGLELNMAGLKYGLPFAHPHLDILKRYRELGGEIITVGADAHKPEHIAYDFHKASEILKACGFKYYTEYTARLSKFVQLP